MCDDITCEYLHLASMAGMDDITYDDLTYDDLNPECDILFGRKCILFCGRAKRIKFAKQISSRKKCNNQASWKVEEQSSPFGLSVL